MKKIFTSLFAMAAVFCASATPTYTVDPESGSTIDDRDNFKVTFTFDEEVTVKSVEFIGGARFNATVTPGTLDVTASKTVEVTVPNTVWGTPDAGQYLIEVNLPEIFDKEGKQIMVDAVDDEGNAFSYAYTASANYMASYDVEAEFIGLDPDPATTTVWDVYSDGWGFVNFLFSDEVYATENSSADVQLILNDGEEIWVPVSSDELWFDWDFWTGSYAVTVPMTPNDDVTQENLVAINVYLNKIKVGANIVPEYAAEYNLTDVGVARKVKGQNTAGNSMTILKSNTTFAIYSINGNIVKTNGSVSDLSNLPAGIYVIDGKKVCVK
jgi:hypothetical protein